MALPPEAPALAASGGWRTTLLFKGVGLAALVLGFVLAMLLLATTAGRNLDHIYRNTS